MSFILGDRASGKTHLAVELTNPVNRFVSINGLDYEVFKSKFYDAQTNKPKPTGATQSTYDEYLEITVKLPAGFKQLKVDWIDTPGEIWRQSWQEDNPAQWQNFLEKVQGSEAILLLLSPYREILKPDVDDAESFITRQQWCKRFERWVEFFKKDCPRARHILLCMNKADLINGADLAQEEVNLNYSPDGARMNWQARHSYVSGRYFRPIQAQINEINAATSGLSVRCFITSVYSRPLLELPWIYLGAYIE